MLHHFDRIDNVSWPQRGESERAAPQDHFEDTVPGYLEWYLNVGYPFVQNPNYGEREERMLSFTRPLVALGETVALHTRPSQVYQAVETLQHIL
ncbi:unnamed protein product [Prunus armeniaca]|uniref:Uncharacterized protein n=1 Tax=Prunus armeniaca TaxID=36596 RepID=A0A6J5W6R9_PRUAR|nr:unnamed protein product [Prunus armeniaca]